MQNYSTSFAASLTIFIILAITQIIANIILMYGILKGKYQQNPVSWALWSIVGFIMGILFALPHFIAGKNYSIFVLLPAILYTLLFLLSFGIFFVIVMKEPYAGENINGGEKIRDGAIFAVFIIFCAKWIGDWRNAGSVDSAYAAWAIIVAGIPQLMDTLKKPEKTPILPYVLFFIMSFLLLLVYNSAWSLDQLSCLGANLAISTLIVSYGYVRKHKKEISLHA